MAVLAQPTAPGRGRALLTAIVSTHRAERRVDLALVAVRIALTWIFIYYGGAKLFGWFNGAGIHGTSAFFANTAHLHPGGFFAVLGGLLEFGGAIALALGLGSRLVGIALIGDMVMAMITVTWGNGIHSLGPHQGYEINVALAALAIVIVLMGAGRYSVDASIERLVTPPENASLQ
jgi:putative oxidoreductase